MWPLSGETRGELVFCRDSQIGRFQPITTRLFSIVCMMQNAVNKMFLSNSKGFFWPAHDLVIQRQTGCGVAVA
jgi:hypothetical protein